MHATEVLDIEVFIFSGRLYLAKVKTRCLAARAHRGGTARAECKTTANIRATNADHASGRRRSCGDVIYLLAR